MSVEFTQMISYLTVQRTVPYCGHGIYIHLVKLSGSEAARTIIGWGLES